MKNLAFYTFLLLISYGCSEEVQPVSKEKAETPLKKKGVINWTFFNKEGLRNISFPIWFNDSVIEQKKIQKIRLSINELELSEDSTFQDTVPSTFYDIHFSKGVLEKIYVKQFSEEIAIEEQSFRYEEKKDSLGYSIPTITNNVIYEENDFLPIFSTLQNAQQYSRLEFDNMDSTSLQFVNTLSADLEKHIFILDSSNWNVHFIDQTFKYPEKNTYYYGLPAHHFESFKIRELVKKDQISSTKYFENDCIYQHSTYSNGFENRRTFLYGKNGNVTGYIDSLLVEPNEFIERKIAKIKYEKNNLPTIISTYKSRDTLYKNPVQEIRLKYSCHE